MPIRDTGRTPFNGALTPHRCFATADLPLADVKAVRAAYGVTVNDVVLGIVAEALRRHLLAVDALPVQAAGRRRAGGVRTPLVTSASTATRCRTCSRRCAPMSPTRSSDWPPSTR